ncbi:MAG: hypothetical protein KF727_09920 [Microbacteriaceae bacterium]|nr:hypothetical protein [Microbacteriaceae bacterium]
MKPTNKRSAPNQTERASQLIELWLTLDLEAQHATLARLIAASVHPGPGSALERFAGTGALDAQTALEEINEARVPLEQEVWLDTLGRFVLLRGGRS